MQMTSQELMAFISVCGEAGVSKVSVGDVYVEFEGKQIEANPVHSWEPVITDDQNSLQNPEEPATLSEEHIRQDELDALMLEDPAEYERQLTLEDSE